MVNVTNSVEIKHILMCNKEITINLLKVPEHEAVTPVASTVRKEVGVDLLPHSISFYQ